MACCHANTLFIYYLIIKATSETAVTLSIS